MEKLEEENIVKDLRNPFRQKKEQNCTVSKDIWIVCILLKHKKASIF